MRNVKSFLFNENKQLVKRKVVMSSGKFDMSDPSGLSLISTLWILTILSVLAMQILYSFNLENKAQGNFIDRTKYHYAAKSGFEWSLAKLRTDETNFDSLGETWAQPIQQQINDLMQVGNILNYQVTITDEGARININTVDETILRNMLTVLGVEPENNPTGDLATRIVEGRPYRTVRDISRVEGMTYEILYGLQQQAAVEEEMEETEEVLPPTLTATSIGGLVNIATVYSVDVNTDTNGQQRVDLNSANAQQISQIRSNNNQTVFSQGEANAIIQQRTFNQLSALLDAQAVSNNVFNSIRNRITVQNTGGGRNQEGPTLTNINTADDDELEDLQGIDGGIADRIISHRDSVGQFQNVDAIKDVKVITVSELAGIVDKISIKSDQRIEGLINVNTAPLEVLQLLPGMDQAKAQAIITRREEENEELQNSLQVPITGNPFSDIGQLLDIEEIDDQTFRQVIDWVTYRSNGYRIQSNGIDHNGKVIATCLGIVERSDSQLSVPYWRQD